MQHSITIANIDIQHDQKGRYCLNDLHRAAGEIPKHKPANFLRLDGTKALIAEIDQCSEVSSAYINVGGASPGTFVCKELVYAYAMWISAAFHLQVIRAYDTARTPAQPVVPQSLSAALRLAADQAEQIEAMAIERDHAIATKAQIGDRRQATSMAKVAVANREVAKLKDQLGFSARHATILQVEDATGGDFGFLELRRWCKANEVTPETVPDKRYPNGVKAWPAGAWMAVYGGDLAELFGEVAA